MGLCRRKTRQGKGAKIRAVAESAGVPIAIPAAPANPNPIPRVEATVEVHFVLVIPTDGSGGGNFSDPNDRRLATQNIEPVIVHRGHQTKRPAQGGRVAGCCGAISNDGSWAIAHRVAQHSPDWSALRASHRELLRVRVPRMDDYSCWKVLEGLFLRIACRKCSNSTSDAVIFSSATW